MPTEKSFIIPFITLQILFDCRQCTRMNMIATMVGDASQCLDLVIDRRKNREILFNWPENAIEENRITLYETIR